MSESSRRGPFYQVVDGVWIPGSFSADIFREALTYKPRPGDLFVASYPKCGTTWTQMIVFLIRNRGRPVKNNPEFVSKMPFLELVGLESVTSKDKYSVKIHLDFEHAPRSAEAKYLYVCRNPKDAVLSYFHHACTTQYLFENGDFDVFFDLYLEGKVEFGDYFDNVLSWYEHRNDPNVLFVNYEEMRRDTAGHVLKIAKFMGEEYSVMLEDDPAILDNILKYSSIEDMKKIFNDHMDKIVGDMSVTKEDIDAMPWPAGVKHVRKFTLEHRTANSKHVHLVRKGLVGGWRDVLTEQQAMRLDDKINQRMEGTEVLEVWKREKCL